MKVWILQTGEPMPTDGGGVRPMRAINLCDALTNAGHEVVLWTADFNHRTLRARYGRHTRVVVTPRLEVRFVASRGYSSNVSGARLLDHAILARNLSRLLVREQPPDVAFVGYPPIETAYVMSRWLADHATPFIVDVKDAWPEVLLRGIPSRTRPLGRVALQPYFHMRARTLAAASGITSTAEPFLAWSQAAAQRWPRDWDMVLPLTARRSSYTPEEIQTAEAWWDDQGVRDDHTFRASFVGTLGSSYDFGPVVAAAAAEAAQFVICGTGSGAGALRDQVHAFSNVVMPGWVSSAQAEVLARRSTVALAPIGAHEDFEMSIPNKFYDAMAHALPVLTSLTGAAGDLTEALGTGVVYSDEWGPMLTQVLHDLEQDPERLKEMSAASADAYESHFSFESVYGRAVDLLERLADA